MSVIYFLTLLTVQFVSVEAPGGKGKSDYSFSKESQFDNPDVFWPISSSLHGNSAPSSSITAVLYDAVLTDGVADLDAVEFDGTSGSFMKITNTGDLDGEDAFCWVINLYPFSAQTATILEYAGSGGSGNGVKLSQEGTSLNVKLYDKAGVLLGDYSRDIPLTINTWNFVGFSYNKAWGHIDIIQDEDLEFHDIGVTDELVNALGDVSIGNSINDTSPFHGKISCIQFYKKALFNNALKNPPSYCTLAQWSSSAVLDWTENFVPTTTVTTTTTLSTTATTSPTESTTELTTTPTESTTESPTTTESTTESPTTTTTSESTTETPTTAESTTESPTTTTTTTESTTEPPTTTTTESTTESTTPTTEPATESTTTTTTESTTESTTATTESTTESTTSPTESTTESSTSPTESTTESTTSPTESTTKSSTSPTESTTESTTSPTESTTESRAPTEPATESTTSPTEPTTESTTSSSESVTESTTSSTETITSSTTTQTPTTTIKSTTATARVRSVTVTDSCYYFRLQESQRHLASDIILEKQGTNLGDCAQLCTSNYQCVLFVLNDNGDCQLSDTTTPSLTAPGTSSSRVYIMAEVDRNLYVHGQ